MSDGGGGAEEEACGKGGDEPDEGPELCLNRRWTEFPPLFLCPAGGFRFGGESHHSGPARRSSSSLSEPKSPQGEGVVSETTAAALPSDRKTSSDGTPAAAILSLSQLGEVSDSSDVLGPGDRDLNSALPAFDAPSGKSSSRPTIPQGKMSLRKDMDLDPGTSRVRSGSFLTSSPCHTAVAQAMLERSWAESVRSSGREAEKKAASQGVGGTNCRKV